MVERLFSGRGDPSDTGNGIADLKRRIVSVDWGSTPAGPVDIWPAVVRSTVRTVLHAASPMAVLIGEEGIIVCNDAAREIFGDAFAEAQGRPIFEVLPVAQRFYRQMIDDTFQGRSSRFRDQPIRLTRDGRAQVCWFNLSLSPVMDDDGTVFGTLLAASETSDHLRTRKALKLAYERVEAALEAGGIVGTWDFDVYSRKVIIDGSLALQYGIAEADARSGIAIETLFDNLHPDDRARVLSAVDEAVASGDTFNNKFRTITKDGLVHWYVASGRPLRDEERAVHAFAGIVIDVTMQTEVATALEQSQLRFDTLVEAIPQIVWSTDRYGNHDFFNSRWTEFTGIKQSSITPVLWTELVHPEDWPRVAQTWQECLTSGAIYDIDYRFRHHSGTYRWLRVIAMPMRDPDGSIVRWYGTSTDIEDAKQLDVHKELINQELDHRIKNLFSLVNGLVGLAVREEPEMAPFAHQLRARLTALHKAHDLVRQRSTQSGSSLKQLLHELLAAYEPLRTATISINGDDAFIKSASITSMALVFHELATNAIKYGSLKSAEGQLSVTIKWFEDWLQVRWVEDFANDGPREYSGPGFGSRLLDSVIRSQFRGELERENSADGVSIDIRLPPSLFCKDVVCDIHQEATNDTDLH